MSKSKPKFSETFSYTDPFVNIVNIQIISLFESFNTTVTLYKQSRNTDNIKHK